MFKNIGVAVSFSPYGKTLVSLASFLQRKLKSDLYFIHIGNESDEKKRKLLQMTSELNLDTSRYKMEYRKADPAKEISTFVERNKIDLLIIGALEKEKTFNYYIGSVARKLMRNVPTNLLICPARSRDDFNFDELFINTDYSTRSESSINLLAELGKKLNSKKIAVIREVSIPGIAITVDDYGSSQEAEQNKNKLMQEEKEQLNLFIKELNIKDIEVEGICLYGREGFAYNQYLRDNSANLSVVIAPKQKPKLFDRIFTSEMEFSIKEIPSPLLIIK